MSSSPPSLNTLTPSTTESRRARIVARVYSYRITHNMEAATRKMAEPESPERRQGDTKRARRGMGPLRFNGGDLIYFYETSNLIHGGRNMIFPGEVLEVMVRDTERDVLVKYWWHDQSSRRRRLISAEQVIRMDSPLLDSRIQLDDANIQLRTSIFSAKHVGSLKSWYERHLQEEATALKRQQQQEAAAKIAAEAAAEVERQHIERQRKQTVVANLRKISRLLKETTELIKEDDELDNLPTSMLVSEKIYKKGLTDQHWNLDGRAGITWGTSTTYQNIAIECLQQVGSAFGKMIKHTLYQQRVAHEQTLRRVNSADKPDEYTVLEWYNMESTIPTVRIVFDMVDGMLPVRRAGSNLEEYNHRKKFVLINVLRSMSSMSAKEPFASMFSRKALFGGLPATGLEDMNYHFRLGVQPSTAYDSINSSTTAISNRYDLPTRLVFRTTPLYDKALWYVHMSDNYGDQIAEGRRSDGTTLGVRWGLMSHLPQWFAEYLDTLSRDEIPIQHASLESVTVLGATFDVDTFTTMYILSNLAASAAHKEIILAACSAGPSRRTSLKEYLDKRENDFSRTQSGRSSRHNYLSLEDGEIKCLASQPTPFYRQSVTGDTQLRGSHWDERAAMIPHAYVWGFRKYGNRSMFHNADAFAHAEVKQHDGSSRRVVADPTLKTGPLLLNSGDAALERRHKRCQRGYYQCLKNNGSTIGWGAPQDAVDDLPVGDDAEIIEWQFADSNGDLRKGKAKVGTRLCHAGNESEAYRLVGDAGNGDLSVVAIDLDNLGNDTEEVVKVFSAQSLRPWKAVFGDSNDFSHEFYRYIKTKFGIFHGEMAALVRTFESDIEAWYVCFNTFRNTSGQATFAVTCGLHKVSFSEGAAIVMGMLTFSRFVFDQQAGDGVEHSPYDMAQWMERVRLISQDWNQIFDMIEGFFKVLLLRAASRSANMGAIRIAIASLVEQFAMLGATDYFQIFTDYLLSQSSISDYELALECETMLNEEGGKNMSNDLLVECLHYLITKSRGKQHGFVQFVAGTQRATRQLPKQYPNWGGEVSCTEREGSLSSILYDPRCAAMVYEMLQKSGLKDYALPGAVNTHTGKPIIDDRNSTVVYDFSGRRINKNTKEKADVAREVAYRWWEKIVFSENNNNLSQSAPERYDRYSDQATDNHKRDLIELTSVNGLQDLIEKLPPRVKKPTKADFALQCELLRQAAENKEFPRSITEEILEIGQLRTTGVGSKKEKEKLQKYVLKESQGSLVQILRALIKFKKLSMPWMRKVLGNYFETDGRDFVEKVKVIAESPNGARQRRAAALAAAKTKMPDLSFAPSRPVSNVAVAEAALMEFLVANTPDRPPDSVRSIEKLNIESMGLNRASNRYGQNELSASSLALLRETSRSLAFNGRKYSTKYRRLHEMRTRRDDKFHEMRAIVEERQAQIQARESSGEPSIWDCRADGSKKRIPIAFLEQAMKQAEDEGATLVATAAKKRAEAAAEQVRKEKAKKDKEEVARQKKLKLIAKKAEAKRKKEAEKKKKEVEKKKKEVEKKKKQIEKEAEKKKKLIEKEAAKVKNKKKDKAAKVAAAAQAQSRAGKEKKKAAEAAREEEEKEEETKRRDRELKSLKRKLKEQRRVQEREDTINAKKRVKLLMQQRRQAVAAKRSKGGTR